jgi:hypothetical protein
MYFHTLSAYKTVFLADNEEKVSFLPLFAAAKCNLHTYGTTGMLPSVPLSHTRGGGAGLGGDPSAESTAGAGGSSGNRPVSVRRAPAAALLA